MDDTNNVNQVSVNTPPQNIEVEPVNTEGSIPISEVQAIPVQPVQAEAPKEPTSAEKATSDEIPVPETPQAVIETNIKEGEMVPESDIEELIDSKELSEVKVDISKKKLKINLSFLSKSVPILFVAIIVVVALLIGGTIGATMFPKIIYSNTSNSAANKNTKARVSDGKNNKTIAGDYTFSIPDKYYYDKSNNGVLVYDTNDSFRIFIKPIEANYEDIANAKTSVKETLNSAELKVSSIKEINIKEHAYLVAETIDNLTNRLIAFTTAGENTSFYIEVVTATNKYDYDCLDLADDIAYNAKAIGEKSNMESINVNDVSKIIISAANIYKTVNS